MDSSTNRATFARAALVINPAVFLLTNVADDGNPASEFDDGQSPIFRFLNQQFFGNL
jgi:hypothetical protein